jgi:hypothetical protein
MINVTPNFPKVLESPTRQATRGRIRRDVDIAFGSNVEFRKARRIAYS